MTDTPTLISNAYAAFNSRNIDAALALMSANVRWPRASEGGEVTGKDEIRAYWLRQWSEFDPHVDPLEITPRADGRFDVRVHQVVRGLAGEVLSDSEVRHTYTVANGLIERMQLEPSGEGSQPSTAFAKR